MRLRAAALFLVAVLVGMGCHLVTPFDVGEGRDGGANDGGDADLDADLDAPADGDFADADSTGDADAATDGDVLSGAGPLVLVVERIALTADLRCDVDGDGLDDNAIADLGAGTAELFAAAVNAAVSASTAVDYHPVFHFQQVEDLSGPTTGSTSLATYVGLDTDYRPDPADDFSGSEPFYADASDLDGCGEPLHVIPDVALVGGALSLTGGSLALSFGGTGEAGRLEIVEASGRIDPHGPTFELAVCGYLRIADLGMQGFASGPEEPSFLEVVLAGGASMGAPAIPGIAPDVDLDGDGVERIFVDADGHIERCIDGDLTVIEGRDCWRDPGIADAFSLSLDIWGVGARYGGREPAWEYMVPHTCADGPAEDGFFSTVPPTDTPCVELGLQCDPRSSTPCCDDSHTCSGADDRTYLCYAPCDPVPCLHGSPEGTAPRLGACLMTGLSGRPLCWALAPNYEASSCILEEEGCTTQLGVSDHTICVQNEEDNVCVELCDSTPAAPCGEGLQCVPLAFEDGGVCARR